MDDNNEKWRKRLKGSVKKLKSILFHQTHNN